MNKEILYKKILDWYDYKMDIDAKGKITEKGYEYNKKFNNIDEALKSWVSTLEDSNQSIFETGDVDTLYNTW